MKAQLTHVLNSHLDLHYGQQHLFRYTYVSQVEAGESPKPYFHPLKTLAGNVVTNFRPHDHVWHHGLAMTQAVLSGQNWWGGPSYVHGEGYVRRPNNGQQQHHQWHNLRCNDEAIVFDAQLHWLTLAGETWINERRKIAVDEINELAGYWTLKFDLNLENSRDETLHFGSPTTEGRPMAGYGGLFWRGPRSFNNGTVMAGNGLEGPEVMSQRAPWLAYTGRHDGSNDYSTLLFVDYPDNVRYPTQWFIRTDPALVSFAFAFDQELELAAGDTLHLQYKVVIANGAWSREQVEAFVTD